MNSSSTLVKSSFKFERDLILIYVVLVLVEGPIRKWLVPNSVGALVAISRDPIAIILIFQAFRKRLFKPFWLCHCWIFIVILMGVGGLITLLAIDLPLQVWAFGLRTNLLHLPLILIIPRCINSNDFDLMLKVLFFIALPMSILMLFQYRSPIDSWINSSAHDGVVQIRSVTGVVRPPGLFTFITGAVEYFTLINSIFLGWFLDRSRNPYFIVYGIVSTLLAFSVSGSRLMLGSLIVVWMGTFLAVAVFRPRVPSSKSVITGVFVTLILSIAIFATPLSGALQEGWANTSKRFEQANSEDGGISSRLFQALYIPDDIIWEAPIFGYGLGLGTNYGSKLTSGPLGFALSESEIQRNLLESGFLIGLLFLGFRNLIVFYVAIVARSSLLLGSHLPFSLFFASVLNLSFGQFRLPTSMGFLVISMAFSLAAARLAKITLNDKPSYP